MPLPPKKTIKKQSNEEKDKKQLTVVGKCKRMKDNVRIKHGQTKYERKKIGNDGQTNI